MKKMIRKSVADEEGQGMVEYALLIGLIALVVFTAIALIGPRVSSLFEKATDSFVTDTAS